MLPYGVVIVFIFKYKENRSQFDWCGAGGVAQKRLFLPLRLMFLTGDVPRVADASLGAGSLVGSWNELLAGLALLLLALGLLIVWFLISRPQTKDIIASEG